MKELTIFTNSITVSLEKGPAIADITYDVNQLVLISKIITGQVSVNIVGSTGSLTTIEYEPGVVNDLKRAINRLAPPEDEYEHELAWSDGNGHSHVQAALLGPSLSLAVRNGKLALGTWQQVVAINHDNRPRNRAIEVTIIGNMT